MKLSAVAPPKPPPATASAGTGAASRFAHATFAKATPSDAAWGLPRVTSLDTRPPEPPRDPKKRRPPRSLAAELALVARSDAVRGYARSLDVRDAVFEASFEARNETRRLRAFASRPDAVLALRFDCAGPDGACAAVEFGLDRAGAGDAAALPAGGGSSDVVLLASGPAGDDLAWAACAVAVGAAPAAVAPDLDPSLLARVFGAETPPRTATRRGEAVVLLVAGATSYDGADPRETCVARLAGAARRGWDDLRGRHVADFRAAAGRATLRLADAAEPRGRPTAERVERLGAPCGNGTAPATAPKLLSLAFAYGRYLLASSSRRGGLPANLQGVWADGAFFGVPARFSEHTHRFSPLGLAASWNGDYHLNINLQMTYWAAWSANVGEAAAPLLDFLEGLAAAGAETASEWYGAPGWVAHGYTDLWRDARALGENKWALCATCGAWAALALSEASEHAPGDAAKLNAAARVLGGALDFFEGYLLPVAAGDAGKLGLPSAPALLSGPSTSPENSYRLNGSAASLRGAAKARDDWGFVALSPAVDVAVLHRLATAWPSSPHCQARRHCHRQDRCHLVSHHRRNQRRIHPAERWHLQACFRTGRSYHKRHHHHCLQLMQMTNIRLKRSLIQYFLLKRQR